MSPSETVLPEVILVADDDEPFRRRLVRAFIARGLDAHGAATLDEAVAIAEQRRPSKAVIDLKLGGRSGLDLIRQLMSLDADINLVMLTGYGSIPTAVDSIRLGATTYLTKPVDAEQILEAFHLQPPDTERVPTAPSLARVEWEHIQRVLADCDGNVTHTAKRLQIHRRSLQRKLMKRSAHD